MFGGSEERLRDSQFGYSIDAIFIVQQMIDEAWEEKGSQLSIIFLDWLKVFDKVDAQAF